MRISDWSSDVCSSDLKLQAKAPVTAPRAAAGGSAGSALVQLGSFPTEGQAKTAWTRVSKRFAYLAPLGQSIEKATVNGNTVYRLRVNAGSADQAKSDRKSTRLNSSH